MPWKIEEREGSFCVVKESDGSTEKCHPSNGEAEAHLKALYASEERKEYETRMWQELNETAEQWAKETVEAARTALGVKAEPPPADEEEPEADPEVEGEDTDPDAEQEVASEATVDVPSGIRKVILNLQQEIAKAFGRKDEELTAFKVVEHPNGSAHWLAVYSNNFKDRDGEVFPAAAIDAYVQRVDTGIVPPPELWVWHAGKNVAIGNADWVGRHGHFTFAAGQFYGGEAALKAKAYYAKHAKDTGISHGFTFPESKFDGKHYHEFNTFEISLLPRGAEANWYTSLEGVKALKMDDKKKQYLEEVFGQEHAARILSDWDKRGKALEDFNVEFKDFTGSDVETPASKEVIEHAAKGVSELLLDVLDSSAQPIEAATAAMKAAKELKAANATLEQRLKAVEDELKLRPRASQSSETLLNAESDAGKALKERVEQQMAETDPFWGTKVVKTP